MATLTLATAIQILHGSKLSFFTLKSLADLFNLPHNRRLYQLVSNLTKQSVLSKLEKNKYHLQHSPFETLTLANFLYPSSYVSFESALNQYGILSQFPLTITSATSKKSTTKIINNQEFTYEHVSPKLFFGYKLIDQRLIAEPEKALLDQTYFHLKKLKSLSIDEYDLSSISKNKLIEYSKPYPKSVYNFLQSYI